MGDIYRSLSEAKVPQAIGYDLAQACLLARPLAEAEAAAWIPPRLTTV